MRALGYKKDYHKSWVCFKDYGTIPKEKILGEKGRNGGKAQGVPYEYTLEIMKACENGAIDVTRFKMDTYVATCQKNDYLDKRKKSKRVVNLVDIVDKDEYVGYGDILLNDTTKQESLEVKEESAKVMDKIQQEYYIKTLTAFCEDYRYNKGIHLAKILLGALSNNQRFVNILNELVSADAKLGDLVHNLCVYNRNNLKSVLERLV